MSKQTDMVRGAITEQATGASKEYAKWEKDINTFMKS